MVLALFAVVVPSKQRRFAFTTLCLMLLLALGKYTPLGQVILRTPGFDSFRGIDKFMFLVLMFLAMLSALGFDWLLRGRAGAAVGSGISRLGSGAVHHRGSDGPRLGQIRVERMVGADAPFDRLDARSDPPVGD